MLFTIVLIPPLSRASPSLTSTVSRKGRTDLDATSLALETGALGMTWMEIALNGEQMKILKLCLCGEA